MENKNKSENTLFKKGRKMKTYWFVEAIVVLIIWVYVLVDDKQNKLTILTLHNKYLWGGNLIMYIYIIFTVFAVFINVWKRIRICKSMKCYLGEEDFEKFQKERRIMNIAVIISTTGIFAAMPIIYMTSFVFRFLFIRFLNKEEKLNKRIY